jgi:peptide/nickel transport system permease protein
MQRYILKRIIQSIITIFLIVVIVFFLVRLTGDPVAMMVPPDADEADVQILKKKLGLDRPIFIQLMVFLKSAATGNFGESFKWQESALKLVLSRFPATLELAVSAMLIATVFGLSIGIISALKQDSVYDRVGKTFSLLGQATPSFWLGVMLMLFFGVKLDWFPVSGRGSFLHLILPATTISLISLASIARLTRSSMIDALKSEYVVMAKIKGVPKHVVVLIHALKNASIPILTLMSMQFSYLIAGTVVVETIFSWPGTGRLAIQALLARDFPVVQAFVLFAAFIYTTVNLVVDILYALIDPRIRYQ